MFTREELIKAHTHCSNNENKLNSSQKCGCFYCMEIFTTDEIKEWIQDSKKTALCPKCGIDSVIGESSGYPITKEFLSAMNEYWF